MPKDDKRIKTEMVTVPSPQGNGEIKGSLVRPSNATGKLPGVLVVHENRGLTPYIEDVARRLGAAGFMASRSGRAYQRRRLSRGPMRTALSRSAKSTATR